MSDQMGFYSLVTVLLIFSGIVIGWCICTEFPPETHRPITIPVGTKVTHIQTRKSGVVCDKGMFDSKGRVLVSWDETGSTSEVYVVLLEKVIEPECLP